MAGGNRALWSLRIPGEHLGARVYPDMLSLAVAHKAFTSEDGIAEQPPAKRIEKNLFALKDLVESSKYYACVKKAWVEFRERAPIMSRIEWRKD